MVCKSYVSFCHFVDHDSYGDCDKYPIQFTVLASDAVKKSTYNGFQLI